VALVRLVRVPSASEAVQKRRKWVMIAPAQSEAVTAHLRASGGRRRTRRRSFFRDTPLAGCANSTDAALICTGPRLPSSTKSGKTFQNNFRKKSGSIDCQQTFLSSEVSPAFCCFCKQYFAHFLSLNTRNQVEKTFDNSRKKLKLGPI